jgi:hypothetical protein
MDRAQSLRMIIATAGSVLIAMARLAPTDVVVTTVDQVSLTDGGASSAPVDLSQSWAPRR